MTRRNARVRREETTTSRDTSSAESTSSITYLYTQVMHLRKSTPSARTGPRRPRTSVALGHPSPSDARVLVDSPVHRIGVDISVCDQEHSRLGDRRANLASHVPGTVKFRTGGDSPRPASFMPAADSVKFRNRQSESGWEEHGGLGRCVSVHMTAPSHTPDRPDGCTRNILPPGEGSGGFPLDAEFTELESTAMSAALDAAREGCRGANPLVGAAILTADGKIVTGHHAGAGSAHAEDDVIPTAHELDIDLSASTLFVTLEPGAHRGRTGPCTEAIIAASIPSIVFSSPDPNPLASGGGRILAEAGLRVRSGLHRDRARELNARWVETMTASRPF